ncbi:protein of unknown function [Sphingomonas laterariae]|uniref:DUF4326 domain-containing protein n=1 Tax=Edaphosphingomonas laterariae TaxID=861865 RepID=A0A239FAM2_9SPHN|nr:DUF4326 domain-containing protein [Sphingomonas laterariae]SNS53949.1 protein of unknown function [Sphingomonas laterariae]
MPHPAPRRLQRPRHARRSPRGAIYVGTRSPWASPFSSRTFGHVAAVQLHRSWLTGSIGHHELKLCGFNEREVAALFRLRERQLRAIASLRGRDLICWCPGASRWCHADTLIALANAERIAA